MNNDNFFVLPRFKAYFLKLLREHWKTNMVRVILMFAAMFIVVMWSSMTTYSTYINFGNDLDTDLDDQLGPLNFDPMHDTEIFIYGLFLFVVGCYWASQMMCDLKRKTGRVFVLTTPVTPFEGWLARWLLHVPFFIIVFLAGLYATDLIRVAVFAPLVDRAPVEVLTWEWNEDFFTTMIFYVCSSSLYVLGSAFFPKRPVLMTSIVLFFVGWIYSFVLFFFSGVIASSDTVTGGMSFFALIRIYMLAATLFCWWLSYRRYKELEVIDRM